MTTVTASFPVFVGNCPRRGGGDARYSVRTNKGASGAFVIGLTLGGGEGEIWYAATEPHVGLVEMVNRAKQAVGRSMGGAFYINEYRQVVVPSRVGDAYYLGGHFDGTLRFEVDGRVVSGEPIDVDGRGLVPGEPWVGPRLGFPYLLSAGGNDITYSAVTRAQGSPSEAKRRLSTYVGAEDAAKVAAAFTKVKGPAGGRFFVNEFGAAFAPVHREGEWRYVYLGQIQIGNWFPPASHQRSETSDTDGQTVGLSGPAGVESTRTGPGNRVHRPQKSPENLGSLPRFEIDELLNE